MSAPRVCFLGLYENAVQVRTDFGMPIALNMLGLTNQVISSIFPFSLRGLGIAISLFEPGEKEAVTLVFRNPATKDTFDITLELQVSREGSPDATGLALGWMNIFGEAPANSVVLKPGLFQVFLKTDSSTEQFLGNISFHYSEPPPLNEATIAAIKADPLARKFARATLVCNKCQDQLKCYTGIERGGDSEADGWIWQADLPETFTCKCGAMAVPLTYMKRGLHSVLRRWDRPPYTVTKMVALYERSALEQYCREFLKLLESKAKKEQVLQTFLQEHKMFLHRFAAIQILTKPPILSKFTADFAVLNNRKELLLVEIERSTLKLLKKTKNSFGITAGLQHAIDQVRSWRQVFDDHRDAALGNIGIEKKGVAKIKGVVIAGRTPEDEDESRYLRALNLDVELFTYDDLISDVVESIRHIEAT